VIASPNARSARTFEDEAALLQSEDGQAVLAEIERAGARTVAAVAGWRRRVGSPERAQAAIRLVDARRKGASKFNRVDAMWLDPVGVEQATTETIARRKARRFAGEAVFDLCSGVGGDALALADAGARVVAIDSEPGMCRRLAWNARVYEVADRVLPVRGWAEDVAVDKTALVHVDPDRRRASRTRASRLGDYQPGVEVLQRLVRQARGGAFKLGPASDFFDVFGGRGFEVELVSLDRECKEATIWFGDLATCSRRATCLPNGATWTDLDGPLAPGRPTLPIGKLLFEPDPALTRSGLLDGFAIVHELARIQPDVALLTGPEPIRSPWLVPFTTIAEESADLKRLRALVRDRRWRVETVKIKGPDLSPERLRAELASASPTSPREELTLFVIGGRGHRVRAIFAKRCE
jgi:SAM-dependent methyltransferase